MEKKKIILEEIPDHIVNKILKKMPCLELIRMRKTCWYINNTVEEDRESFSRRVDVGIAVSVLLHKENNMTKLSIVHRNQEAALSVDAHLEDHFSGVSVSTLSLVITQFDQQGLLVAFLRRMNFCCVKLEFLPAVPVDKDLVQLADLVECRTTEFNRCLEFDNKTIEILLASPKKSTFTIEIDDENEILGRLEVLLNFQKVRWNGLLTTEQIHLLIAKITTLTDLGALEKLSVCCPDETLLHDQSFDLPPSKLLWEIENPHFMDPDHIYKFDLSVDKCALVSILSPPLWNCDTKHVEIKFVNDTPEEILNVLIEKLRIQDVKSSDKKKYFESSDAEQIELIREIYTGRRTNRRSC